VLYTLAEVTFTQSLPDWIGSHVRAFNFFGCVPEIVVPDNLKSAFTNPCRYEPDINTTYADMAWHYGVAIIPARGLHYLLIFFDTNVHNLEMASHDV
jgi:transposase